MTWDDAHKNPLGYEQPSMPEEMFKEAALDRYNYCVSVAKMFKSEAGKAILEKWREITIESSAWSPSLAQQSGLDAANAHAYAREGQNAFVRDIEACIEVANKYKGFEDFYSGIPKPQL